jgi:hypothetical protein
MLSGNWLCSGFIAGNCPPSARFRIRCMGRWNSSKVGGLMSITWVWVPLMNQRM